MSRCKQFWVSSSSFSLPLDRVAMAFGVGVIDRHDLDPGLREFGAAPPGHRRELGTPPTSPRSHSANSQERCGASGRAECDHGPVAQAVLALIDRLIAADDVHGRVGARLELAVGRLQNGWQPRVIPPALRSLGSRRTKGELGGFPDTRPARGARPGPRDVARGAPATSSAIAASAARQRSRPGRADHRRALARGAAA